MTLYHHIKPLVENFLPVVGDVCSNYVACRNQRLEEFLVNHSSRGVRSYREYGCFRCHGRNIECLKYNSYNNIVMGDRK